MDHLQKYKVFSKLQHGYQHGCSTETQLIRVIDLFAKGLEKKSQVDCISLDFARAFDTVPHERLLLKMNYYGIRKLLPWIRHFLTGRSQRIMVDGVKSRVIQMISGIGQGTVLAGLCFLIFINDLPTSITDSFFGIFCDDTLIAREITSNNSDANSLQNDLSAIEEWSSIWGMKFNTDKCVVMSVTNKKTLPLNNYFLNGVCLSRQNYIKYLGVYIDNKLTFRKHIEEKVKSATKVLNLLRRNLYYAPVSVKSKAYFACVRPILEYGNTCWSPTSEKSNHAIEMVQHNAAKFATNCYPKKGHYQDFSIHRILQDLDWTSLKERRDQAKVTMVYKILNNHVIISSETLPRVSLNRPRKCNEAKVGLHNQLVVRDSRLNTTVETFYYAAPRIWNNTVSASQAAAPSTDAFKQHFAKK